MAHILCKMARPAYPARRPGNADGPGVPIDAVHCENRQEALDSRGAAMRRGCQSGGGGE